ncbi:MAG: hypothetical protein N2441_07560 [Rhodocyclaceae bacterium]|nr:hypothetical protein [Rhodocyclaceae bacterium]
MDARDVEVLARAPGFLRLRLPLALRRPEIGQRLEAELSALPGMRYVCWHTPEGKLALRFDPRRLEEKWLAARLFAMLAKYADQEPRAEDEPVPTLGERLGDLKARLITLAPHPLRPLIERATTEKALLNFANDVLLFYLIRVHWSLISERWLKAPAKHLDAWLAVFYLFFLLVRFRRS